MSEIFLVIQIAVKSDRNKCSGREIQDESQSQDLTYLIISNRRSTQEGQRESSESRTQEGMHTRCESLEENEHIDCFIMWQSPEMDPDSDDGLLPYLVIPSRKPLPPHAWLSSWAIVLLLNKIYSVTLWGVINFLKSLFQEVIMYCIQ